MAIPFVRAGDRLLDVGCFDRSLIDRVLPRIESAIGIDIVAPPSVDGRVEIRQRTLSEDPPFESGSFDCITMLAVLEHIEDPASLAIECERILAPGGRLVLTVPHPAVDTILDGLMLLRLVDGMAAEEHHGFDVKQTRTIFETANLGLHHQRHFQMGLNRLYVFEKLPAVA